MPEAMCVRQIPLLGAHHTYLGTYCALPFDVSVCIFLLIPVGNFQNETSLKPWLPISYGKSFKNLSHAIIYVSSIAKSSTGADTCGCSSLRTYSWYRCGQEMMCSSPRGETQTQEDKGRDNGACWNACDKLSWPASPGENHISRYRLQTKSQGQVFYFTPN